MALGLENGAGDKCHEIFFNIYGDVMLDKNKSNAAAEALMLRQTAEKTVRAQKRNSNSKKIARQYRAIHLGAAGMVVGLAIGYLVGGIIVGGFVGFTLGAAISHGFY